MGDVRGKVRFLHAVVDSAGLAFAKDIRIRVLRLTAELDARVPASKQTGLDQASPRWPRTAGPASRRPTGPPWTRPTAPPSWPGCPSGSPMSWRPVTGWTPPWPCWRAHLPVVWELGDLWAEWRRVYDRKAPELAGALGWHGRWLPGALERVRRALSECTDRQCILTTSVAARHPP